MAKIKSFTDIPQSKKLEGEITMIQIGDLAKFYCFDGSVIVVQVTEIHDKIIYGKSKFGYHWANPKNVELISNKK